MTELGTAQPSDELRELAARQPHLREHLMKFKHITGEFPVLIDEASSEYETDRPNVIYPVGGPIYAHVYGDVGADMKYYAIEPSLSQEEAEVFEYVKNKLLEKSVQRAAPDTEAEYDDRIEELLGETVAVEGQQSGGFVDDLRGRVDVADVGLDLDFGLGLDVDPREQFGRVRD